MKRLLFFISLSLVVFGTSTNSQTWVQQTSGTIRTLLAVSFSDTNNGTAVGNDGTILRTTNSGQTWTAQIISSYPEPDNVSFINSNTGTIICQGGEIYRTTDGGQNWTQQSSNTTQALRGIFFVDINTGWIVGAEGEILKTSNGGQTWIKQTSGTTGPLWAVCFTDVNTGTAVGGDYSTGGVILRTTDGGQNWTQQTSKSSYTLYGVSFTDANHGFVVSEFGAILRTTNGGQIWTALSPPTGYGLLKISFSDPNNGVAVGQNGTIVRTTDGGQNWVVQNSGTTEWLWGIAMVSANTAWAVGGNGIILKYGTGSVSSNITVTSPNGGENWQVASAHNITWTSSNVANVIIEYSTNNGSTWNGIVTSNPASGGSYSWTIPNAPSTQCKVRVSDAANPTTVQDVSDNSFTISSGSSTGWIAINSGLTITDVRSFAVIGTNLFVGTDGGVFLSTNNGTNWTAVNSGLTTTHIYVLAVSGTNLFAGTWGGGVFLSSNNGTSWTAVNSGLTATYVSSLAVIGTNLFAGTADGGIFLSTNNGTSWTAVNSGLTATNVHALAVSGTNLFAGTYGGGVFFSSNNGTSWTAVNSGLTATYVLSLVVSGTNLFLGADGGVFLSTNNGTNWTTVNSGLTNTDVFALAVSGTNLFAGTDGGGVFFSSNNGTSWTAVNSGLTNMYVHALTVSGTNLFAGTRDGGVWRRPLSEMITPVSSTVTVTSPNGGENWQVGSAHNITWTSSNVANVIIEYSTNNGSTWNGIVTSNPASGGSYSWTIPNAPSTQCKVRVSDAANPTAVHDESDNVFTISSSSGITGLVAYYPFNGNANDASGNGWHGVNYGAVLTTDRFGNPNRAYSFDGTSSYIDIPGTNALHLTPGLALCAWINFTDASNLHEIVGKHISGYGNGYYLMIRPATSPEFFISSEPGLQSPDAINDGHWHFLVGNYDGVIQTLYVDGNLKSSQAKIYSTTNDSTVMIGKQHEGVAANWFSGKIDDIRIYSRPLSEMEITALLNEGPVGVKEYATEIPSGFELEQNYPNPFNPSTTISYAIPTRSHVTLSVFNTLGQKSADLVNSDKEAGVYDATFDATGLASGVYLYRMQAGNFVQTRKLIVVK